MPLSNPPWCFFCDWYVGDVHPLVFYVSSLRLMSPLSSISLKPMRVSGLGIKGRSADMLLMLIGARLVSVWSRRLHPSVCLKSVGPVARSLLFVALIRLLHVYDQFAAFILLFLAVGALRRFVLPPYMTAMSPHMDSID